MLNLIIIEIIRAIAIFFVFLLLVVSGMEPDIRSSRGWRLIIAGFGCVLFGSVLQMVNHLADLADIVLFKNDIVRILLEEVFGFLSGFLLLAIGFSQWLPMIGSLKETKLELERVNDDLEVLVEMRTQQLQEEILVRKKTELRRERLIKELERTLNEMKILRGILPICSYCKRIRNDKGYWEQVDSYIAQHSGVDFSHGVCPSCIDKYTEFYKADWEIIKQ